MNADPARTPVIIGVGQFNDRDNVHDSLGLMVAALEAAGDAGEHVLLAPAQHRGWLARRPPCKAATAHWGPVKQPAPPGQTAHRPAYC